MVYIIKNLNLFHQIFYLGRQQLKEKQLEEETKQKNRYTYE